jgi:oxygen-independent coproporphyrinogen-3 oxidase
MSIASAYIHVPFCRHRCGYCDFTLVAGRDDLIGRYLDDLAREMDQSGLDAPVPLETLFFGGGTPSHPSAAQLQRLFKLVRERFVVSADAEISLEANPLDLNDEKIELLADCGVHRISLGVQSFDAEALKLLERDHRPADVGDVFQRLRRRFVNISVDLIFGVPGQTLDSWRDTLRRAVDLGPAHISTYGLTWEPGTAFSTRRRRGELAPAAEELERDQYALAMDVLAAAGFEQYEISNFARRGFRCRHHLVYWRGDEYWAFGPGAARYVRGRRETNIRSVLGWMERIERGESPVAEREELDPAHRARELIYLGLRMIEGISLAEFARRTGWNLLEFAAPAIRETQARGWTELTATHLRLTREGRFLADRATAEFL